MREVLGEEGELDAGMLEESWASGVAVGWEAFRVRREKGKAGESASFAELNRFGSFAFCQTSGGDGERRAGGDSARARDSYTANWLRDPAEELGARRVKEREASGGGHGCVGVGTMTRERACELLGVGEGWSAMQIKTAYRRMVSEWHPDRMEQSGETVRAFATEQMVAINEAYHFLRSDAVGSAGSA